MKSLFLIPALGVCGLVLGADEVLCAGVNGGFSPDGGRVAFQRDAGKETYLGIFDLRTKEIVWVEKGPGRAAFPAWTPKGALVYSFGNQFHTAYETWKGDLKEGYGLRIWDGCRRRGPPSRGRPSATSAPASGRADCPIPSRGRAACGRRWRVRA